MKCLSLWQPWASLLVHGLKSVETRGWPLRHRGPLAVHAAKKWDADLHVMCHREPFLSALRRICALDFTSPGAEPDLPFGAIVGRVNVSGCIATERVGRWEQDAHEHTNCFFDNLGVMGPADGKPYLFVSDDEREFGDYSPGRFAIICREPFAFAEPIPYRGAQGLFDVPDDVLTGAV